MRERPGARFNETARGSLRAPFSSCRAAHAGVTRNLPPDQPIVSFFCATGAFFGSVSDSTPS